MALFYKPRKLYTADPNYGGGGKKVSDTKPATQPSTEQNKTVVQPDAAKGIVPTSTAMAAASGAAQGLGDALKGVAPEEKSAIVSSTGKKSGGGRGYGGGGGAAATPTSIGDAYNANTKLNIQTADPAELQRLREALSAEYNPDVEKPEIERVNRYDKTELVNNLDQQVEAARQQYTNQIDNAVDTQARDLNRALADAQAQFQTQQNQVTAEEMNARDNAALYAEARGDKGGIGQAQYNSIMNTAAQNRLAIRQAQSKLASDVTRQITDLRTQGEFDKADKMLDLTQQYLSELRTIEQFAANYNLSVDQINTAISEWEAEYEQAARQFQTNTELQLAQLTGMFSNGMSTYDARRETQKANADLALNLLEAGVKPNQLSTTQLSALAEYYGLNQSAINNYFKQANKYNY